MSSLTTPTSKVAGTDECPQLALLKAVPYDALMVLARGLYQTSSERSILQDSVSSFLLDQDSAPVEHKLAELLYHRRGALFVKQQRFNELTRLQLEHECLVRGLMTREKLSSCSNFALMVHLKHDEMALAGATTGRPVSTDSGYSTGSETSESDESSDDSDYDVDDGKGVKYVRSWSPKLGRCVTYRY